MSNLERMNTFTCIFDCNIPVFCDLVSFKLAFMSSWGNYRLIHRNTTIYSSIISVYSTQIFRSTVEIRELNLHSWCSYNNMSGIFLMPVKKLCIFQYYTVTQCAGTPPNNWMLKKSLHNFYCAQSGPRLGLRSKGENTLRWTWQTKSW